MALETYSLGTVSVTNGSKIVTLSAGAWLWLQAWAVPGNQFAIAGESQANYIRQWIDETHVELVLPVARATAAGLGYGMMITAPAFGTNRLGAMTNIERIRLMAENAGLGDFLGVGTNGLVAPALADRLAGFDASNSNAIVPMMLRELLRAGTRVLPKSADYAVTTDDYGALIAMSAGTGPRYIPLPAAATAGAGFIIGVKKTDGSANAITIDPAGAETIDDSATAILATKGATVWLRCDGVGWQEDAAGGGISAFMRTVFDDADQATARATLGAAGSSAPTIIGPMTLTRATDGNELFMIGPGSVQNVFGQYGGAKYWQTSGGNLILGTATLHDFSVATNNNIRMRVKAAAGEVIVGAGASPGYGGGAGFMVQQNGAFSNAVTGALDSSFMQRDTFGNFFAFYHGGLGSVPSQIGRIQDTGTAAAFLATSDARLKTIIEAMSHYEAYNLMDQITPFWVEYISNPGQASVSLLADELQRIAPYLVSGDPDAVEDIGTMTVPAVISPAYTLPEVWSAEETIVGLDADGVEQTIVVPPRLLHDGQDVAEQTVEAERVVNDVPLSMVPAGATWVKTGERIDPQMVNYAGFSVLTFSFCRALKAKLEEQADEHRTKINALTARLDAAGL